MDAALLDLLEERGVKQAVIGCVLRALRFPGDPCDCTLKERAVTNAPPHHPGCSMWVALKALGLQQLEVDREHEQAAFTMRRVDLEIAELVRGRRVSRGLVERRLSDFGDGKFFRAQVERVMAAQAQLEARDSGRAAEAQAIDDLKRHALINDPEVRRRVGEWMAEGMPASPAEALERRPSLMTIRSIPADSERPPNGST